MNAAAMASADVGSCAAGGRGGAAPQLRGGYFILQLHDELIYETTEDDVIQVRPSSL